MARSASSRNPQGLVRLVRIELSKFVEGAGLAEISVSTIGDNISLGIIERGGNIELITDLQAVLSGGENMVDGDIVTNWGMQTYHQTQTGFDIFNRIIFDLGAHYWIDQIRIIGEPAGAPSRIRSRYANFFWYQLLASDGSIAPDGTLNFHEIAFVDDSPLNETTIPQLRPPIRLAENPLPQSTISPLPATVVSAPAPTAPTASSP